MTENQTPTTDISLISKSIETRVQAVELEIKVIREQMLTFDKIQTEGSASPNTIRSASTREELRAHVARITPTLEGWCSPSKAELLSNLIVENDCKNVVEIGIFGGRSLIPMALTMKYLGRGQVWGVEPWSNSVAVETETNAVNDAWWASVDFSKIKRGYFETLFREDLLLIARTLEVSSDVAYEALKLSKYDLIHIDGSHSEVQAYNDAVRWAALLGPNGILVFDDIAWPSVAKARRWILDNFEVLNEVYENDSVSYGAYRKRQ